jgi:uncharacterized membrane protein YphA (DoxX/SURF4 family)
MATTYPIHPSTSLPASEADIVHTSYTILKYAFGLVPIIAGADKFTNLIVDWEKYLNPIFPRLLNMTSHNFMLLVGVIEIVAGIVVFLKPRLGAFIVMAWLLGISLQLVAWGQHFDVAIRDTVMALSALTVARLAPFEQHRRTEGH